MGCREFEAKREGRKHPRGWKHEGSHVPASLACPWPSRCCGHPVLAHTGPAALLSTHRLARPAQSFLPRLPDDVVAASLADGAARAAVSAASPPSCAFFTFVNAKQTLTCCTFNRDGSRIAGALPRPWHWTPAAAVGAGYEVSVPYCRARCVAGEDESNCTGLV